jgi:hypothetical protein
MRIGKNNIYLETFVNGILWKRHNITSESKKKVVKYMNLGLSFKTVSFHMLVTDRLLPVGKINNLV